MKPIMKNQISQFIAGLLPARIIYFCYIRFMAEVTTFEEGRTLTPDQVTFSKATNLYEKKHGKFY